MKRGVLILAGGKGSRMGNCQKGELLYNGSTFLDILMESFLEENIYIATKKTYLADKEANYLYDCEEEFTPLEAIINGFEKSDIDIFFVVACDMPFMKKDVFIKMLESLKDFDGAICYDEQNFLYPLGAIYTRKLLPQLLKQRLEKNYRLKDIFLNTNSIKLSMESLNIEEERFININTPQEYERYVK